MPELLHARVEACYQLAEDFFKRSFPRPEVSFKLRGQKAGVAHLQENLLRFNPKLYTENREHFLKLIDMGIDRMGVGYRSVPVVLGLKK